jgi:hypothetical protein
MVGRIPVRDATLNVATFEGPATVDRATQRKQGYGYEGTAETKK